MILFIGFPSHFFEISYVLNRGEYNFNRFFLNRLN